MRIILQANTEFIDKNTKKIVRKGEILETQEYGRAGDIISRGLGKLKRIRAKKEICIGRKTFVFHRNFLRVGGIETSIFNLAKYAKNSNVTFIFEKIDLFQACRIAQYCDVIIIDSSEFWPEKQTVDVLIIEGYQDAKAILPYVKAKKIYQMAHADWRGYKKLPEFKNFEWKIPEEVDKVVAISKNVQDGLQNAFLKPIESVVVSNPPAEVSDPLVLLTLSRLTAEKGGERIAKIVEQMDKENRDYIWLIASTGMSQELRRTLSKSRNVVLLDASEKLKPLIRRADYLVQLSDTEGHCYSVREALSVGTPVIVTKVPGLEEKIAEGKNAFLLKPDLSNLKTTIKKLFGKRLKPKPENELPDPKLDELLQGEL